MWCNWSSMGIWGWTMMAGYWVLVVALVVFAVREATARSTRGRPGALRILDEALARGDIDPVEYRGRRSILETRK